MATECDIDPRIQRLKSTTFCGKRLTRRQIADIQETVGRFPKLGQTLCEHPGWQTPKGRNRIQWAMRVLEQLEQRGILTLPAKQGPGRGRQKPVELRPLRLELARGARGGGGMERMGAALPSAGLPPADRGAPALLPAGPAGAQAGPACCSISRRGGSPSEAGRAERETPIVPVGWPKNLASYPLGLARQQLAPDWQRQHGSRPVLVETYTDPERHRGTCYKAVNWQRVGRTQGPAG